jgi:hypothetical protein
MISHMNHQIPYGVEVKSTKTGLAYPIYKCCISGEEITDAGLANVEWSEQYAQNGTWRLVRGPIIVLKGSCSKSQLKGILGADLSPQVKLSWSPLDVWHLQVGLNSGIDYEKASQTAKTLSMI